MNLMEKYRARLVGISEERRRTSEMVMDATIRHYRDLIIKQGERRWKPSERTHVAEAKIEKLQHEIYAGRGKLEDFKKACAEWLEAGLNEPTTHNTKNKGE
jgi:hypothetical protein